MENKIKCIIPKERDLGILLLRLFIAFLFLFGAFNKFFVIGITMFSTMVWNQVWLAWIIAIIELLGGLGLLFGILTRQFAVALSIIDLFAIFLVVIHTNVLSLLLHFVLLGGLLNIILSGTGKYAVLKD